MSKVFSYEVYIRPLKDPIKTDRFEDWVEIWPSDEGSEQCSKEIGDRYIATDRFVESVDEYMDFCIPHPGSKIEQTYKFKPAFSRAIETKILDLEGMELFDWDIRDYVVPFLEANPEIISLNVKNNKIEYEGIQSILRVKSLKEINYDNNPARL